MDISLIVPLHGEGNYAQELTAYVNATCDSQNVKEIIFISTDNNTDNNRQLLLLREKKVKAFTITKAANGACMEAGAFEASGDVLFFIKSGTFPVLNFDKIILACLQKKKGKAGVFQSASTPKIWQTFIKLLPVWYVFCFMRVDNLFTYRYLFHLKSKLLSRQKPDSFSSLIQKYAVTFNAKLI